MPGPYQVSTVGTNRYVSINGAWVQVPYGQDPQVYGSLVDTNGWEEPDQSAILGAQSLANALETRDTNRAAVLSGYADVTQQQQAASDLANSRDVGSQAAIDAANQAALGLDTQAYMNLQNALGASTNLDLQTLQAMMGIGAQATELDNAANNRLTTSIANADAMNMGNYAALAEAQQGALGGEQYALTNLRHAQEGIDPITGVPYGADLTSRAGASTADPYATGLQRDAAGAYQGVAAGSQDIASQAAQARADQTGINAQRDALAGYSDFADSAGDLESARASAYADPRSVAQQRDASQRYLDIASGAADLQSQAGGVASDPRAVQAQMQALAQMQSRSGGDLTAVERAQMEDARRTEERDRASAMDAQLRDMEARGVRGSGAEIGAMLGAQQQTSENRMLQDMLALASAQERGERNTGSAAGLASSIRGSSFGEGMDVANAQDAFSLANRDAALSALGQYAGLGTTQRSQSYGEAADRVAGTDEFSLANRDSLLAALDRYGALGGDIRSASYEEAMGRGTAADAAATANRDTRVDAIGDYADLGTAMRTQGFGEQMQAGTASDAMDQFNRTNSLAQANWDAEFARQQQESEWQRAQDMNAAETGAVGRSYDRASNTYDAGQQTVSDMYNREGDIYAAQTGTADSLYDRASGIADQSYGVSDEAYDRSSDLSGYASGLTAENYDRSLNSLNNYNQTTQNQYQRSQDSQDNTTDYTGLFTGQGTNDGRAVNDSLNQQIGIEEERRAEEALNNDDDNLIPGVDIPFIPGI